MAQESTNAEMDVIPAARVTINGVEFVSGLFWQTLTRPRAFMKEAREIGKREKMDIVAIRYGTIMQAGFVGKNLGILKGMYSLASSLAGCLGKSWIGVFDLEDGRYAFVAVHDGAIVPDCDIIGDRNEVLERFSYIYSYFSWEKVYAPDDFDYGGEVLNIRALLTNSSLKKEYRLKQLSFGLTLREGITLICLLAVIGGSAWAYLQWKNAQIERIRQERIRQLVLRQQQLAELNARAKRAQSMRALEHPWAKLPSASDFVSVCVANINATPLAINGWDFVSAKCSSSTTSNQLIVMFKRTGNATTNDIINGIHQRYQVDPALINDGQAQTASVTLDLKLLYGGDDPLQPSAAILSGFTSHFQAMGIQPSLDKKHQSDADQPKLMPGQDPSALQQAPKPDWTTYTFAITDSDLAPEQLFNHMDGTALRFTDLGVKLDLDSAKLTWNAAGEIYAK
jgi:hypothetical protein